MTTLQSIGIDPKSHGFISADLLLASKLSALYKYAKELEEECARKSKYIEGLQDIIEIDSEDDYNAFTERLLADISNPDRKSVMTETHEPTP